MLYIKKVVIHMNAIVVLSFENVNCIQSTMKSESGKSS